MDPYIDKVVDGGAAAAWCTFRSRLADGLAGLETGSEVFLTPESPLGDRTPYLHVEVDDVVRVRIESFGGLSGRFRLSAPVRHALRELGLRSGESGEPELVVDRGLVDLAAHLATVVLRDGWATVHPAFVEVLGLDGLVDVLVPDTDEPAPIEMPDLVRIDDPADVSAWVDQVFGEVFGHEPRKDSHGYIPVRAGQGRVTISVRNGGRRVEVWSVVARQVSFGKARKALSRLQRQHPYVQFFLHRDDLVASMDVQTRPLVPQHLRFALDHMIRVVRSEADLGDALAGKRHRRRESEASPDIDPGLRLLHDGFVNSIEWFDLASDLVGGDRERLTQWITQARHALHRARRTAREADPGPRRDALDRAAQRWRDVADVLGDVREADRHLDRSRRGEERSS